MTSHIRRQSICLLTILIYVHMYNIIKVRMTNVYMSMLGIRYASLHKFVIIIYLIAFKLLLPANRNAVIRKCHSGALAAIALPFPYETNFAPALSTCWKSITVRGGLLSFYSPLTLQSCLAWHFHVLYTRYFIIRLPFFLFQLCFLSRS